MKNSLLFLLMLSFCAVSHSFAQTEKALLWEVSGNGLAAPSYLFGTIHVTCANDLKITEPLKETIEKSARVYFEIDMDDPNLYPETIKHMYLPEGKSLRNLLKKDDYELLSRFFRDTLSMNFEGVERMKPFMIVSLMYAKMASCTMAQGYEMVMTGLVQKAKKEIFGLETVAEQMAAINSFEPDGQAEMLLQVVKEWKKNQRELKALLAAYNARDLQKLEKLMRESSAFNKDFENKLLDKRNGSWLKAIPAIMSEKPTLFAFGALHLVGENGIINLLKKAGYTLKPIE